MKPNAMMKSVLSGCLMGGALLFCTLPLPAHAAVSIKAVEEGDNVVFTMDGTLDLSAWQGPDYWGTVTSWVEAKSFGLGGNRVSYDSTELADAVLYWNPEQFIGPPILSSVFVSSDTDWMDAGLYQGDYLALGWDLSDSDDPSAFTTGLLVRSDYESGEALRGSATFTGQTIASMGLTPGVYTWSWCDGAGTHGDSITLNVVPEPSAFALAGLGAAAVLILRRRR